MNEQIIMILTICAAVLYLSAAILDFFKKTVKISRILWILGIACNAAIVIDNWIVNGYVPFVSMYQVLTFLALIFAPIYLYVWRLQDGGWMARYFCFASGICMIGVNFMSGGGLWHFPPALQSVWFVPHILAYMIAYSLCAVACILTVTSFFHKNDRPRLDAGTYSLVCAAFPFMTMGMLWGAIWANDIWGAFWSFDAKENWALVTWLMYAVYLHFRRHGQLKKFAKIFVVLGFICIVITMLFVNVMGGSSQHSYSM